MDRKVERRKNICMFSIHSSPVGKLGTRDTGGMSVYLLETAKYLGGMGCRVDLVTLAEREGGNSVYGLADGVRLVCLDNPLNRRIQKEDLLRHLPRVRDVFIRFVSDEQLSYSLLHSHYWLSGVLAEMVKSRLGISHLASFHTLGAVKNKACGNDDEPALRVTAEREVVKKCEALICFTGEEKVDLEQMYGASRKKIYVVPCGVDRQLFRPVQHLDEAAKSASAEAQILFVGRMVEIKGLDVLLRALSTLREFPIRLLIAGGDRGDHPAAVQLTEKAERLGVGDRITMLGCVEHRDLPGLYSRVDLVVWPSLHETFGLVPLEALSCGVPVIGSAVGGLPAIMREGCGALVAPGDAEDLAEKIRALLFEKTIPVKSRKEIRRTTALYTWKRTAESIFHIYEET